MQKKSRELLAILQDNEFHSGEEIGRQLKVTRAAVWKMIQTLQQTGFLITAISRRGYRLEQSFEFLSQQKILECLSDNLRKQIKLLEIFDVIDSTNTYLLQQIHNYATIPRVCIAEMQTEGRGRHNRKWYSPYAQNIYLSLLWRLPSHQISSHVIPLITALSIVEVIETLNLPGIIQLKWPNDVYFSGKKIAGVLVEMTMESNSHAQVIIGIGLNVNMRNTTDEINSWTSLYKILKKDLNRNSLIAALLERCIANLEVYQVKGFGYFQKKWHRYDLFLGKKVQLQCHDLMINGISHGVDHEGRLVIGTRKKKNSMFSVGEIL